MKKNLLGIIILFLLIVNITLTGIMMFSLVVPNQRALALMTDVATVLKLELPTEGSSEAGDFIAPEVPIRNVTTYNVADGESMRIPLKMGPEDSSTKYIMLRAALSMDSKNRGYRDTDDGNLSSVDTMIQDVIIRTISQHTMEEVRNSVIMDQIRSDIVLGLHALYNSDFIFSIVFRDIIYS